MTGQLGIVYLLHFDRPYQHARHYTGWTGDDVLDPHRAARNRPRCPADDRHPRGRDRVHPGPPVRRHPRHRTGHQERRRRRPLLPAVHPPAVERPLGPGPRRSHPPLLPLPPRTGRPSSCSPISPEGGTSHDHDQDARQARRPLLPRRLHRQGAPQRGGHRLAVAHRTHSPSAACWPLLPGSPARSPSSGPPWSWPPRSASSSASRGHAGSPSAGSGACWHATGSTGCAGRPGCTPAPDGCPWSCGPGPPRSGSGCSSGAGQASAPTTSSPHSGELAAACYAREARVTRNTAWSQIVTVNIIRRDTLAARHKVGTPLSRLRRLRRLRTASRPRTGSSSRTTCAGPWPQPTTTAAAQPPRAAA